jgi:hypothetical protein
VYKVPVSSKLLIFEKLPQDELYVARYTLYPAMFDDVLAFHESATECVAAATPVPVSDSVVVVGCALLVNVNVAPAEPATVGLNVIVNEALWPAGIVCGSENPPIVNTELFVLAPVTVTLAPLAVRVPLAVPLEPTVTSPNASEPGETVNCPTAAVTPVPDTGNVKLGLLAFDVTVRFPLAAPAVLGAKDTVNVALAPLLSVKGVVIPLKLKPVPVTPS